MSSEPAAKRQRKEGSSPAEIAADLAECSKQLSSKMREVRDSKAKVSKVRFQHSKRSLSLPPPPFICVVSHCFSAANLLRVKVEHCAP